MRSRHLLGCNETIQIMRRRHEFQQLSAAGEEVHAFPLHRVLLRRSPRAARVAASLLTFMSSEM